MSQNKKNAQYYYKEVQNLLDKHKVSDGVVNWGAVCIDLFNIENPVVTEQELKNESADYSERKTENSAWTFSLYIMAWLLYNLKMKTQNGHCQSTAHGHGKDDPKCNKGSKFHNDLYTKCFKSFKEILDEFEKEPPKPIS